MVMTDKATFAPRGSRASKFRQLGLYQGAEPTRTWKPGKVWVARDGIFAKTPKCLNSYAPFESHLESLGHLLLSVDPRIQYYVCQPNPLLYWMESNDSGRVRREYTPDFIALNKDECLFAIDTKASYFAEADQWVSRVAAIRQAYRFDHGVELLVWTERDLYAEPRLSNARTMYRHRHAPQDPSSEYTVRRTLEAHGGVSSIGQLCEEASIEARCQMAEAFGSVMRLGLAGEVVLASGAKYGRNTEVRFNEAAE